MNKIKISILVLILFQTVAVHAFKVDSVQTYSDAMKKNIKVVVVTPDKYDGTKEFPVLYFLHGYGGNCIRSAIGKETYADMYNMIIVFPDGNNSWYWDSPINNNYKYETYVSKELVDWVDGKYKTIKNKSGRGIVGGSMGGHGALYLAFRHQDTYSVVGSMSGGVDLRTFPKSWNLIDLLGDINTQPDNWYNYSVIKQVDLLTNKSLTIFIDCGADDFFFKANQELHNRLVERGIDHEFLVRPGKHESKYMNYSVKFQMFFMCNYFKGGQM